MAVLERPIGRRLVPSLSLECRAEVLSLSTQVEANVEVHEHSGSAPLFLLNTGEYRCFEGWVSQFNSFITGMHLLTPFSNETHFHHNFLGMIRH
ncbi:hypothetical protein E2C01_072118 [Portunus trituberculatus]|uniref:Uncharacterized protein n=1 Tax=Portunus trituberculatus TaxID=210409 RepID=A0A5B7I6Y9_PORTR|nr:hypothetical protein [Portunus trituberculatus]